MSVFCYYASGKFRFSFRRYAFKQLCHCKISISTCFVSAAWHTEIHTADYFTVFIRGIMLCHAGKISCRETAIVNFRPVDKFQYLPWLCLFHDFSIIQVIRGLWVRQQLKFFLRNIPFFRHSQLWNRLFFNSGKTFRTILSVERFQSLPEMQSHVRSFHSFFYSCERIYCFPIFKEIKRRRFCFIQRCHILIGKY